MTTLKKLILSEDVEGLQKMTPRQLMDEKIDGKDPTILFALRNGKLKSAQCIWGRLTPRHKKALREEHQKSAISMAILSGDEKILDFVIKEFKCDVRKLGISMTEIAAENDCRKIFLHLLEIGAEPNQNYFLDNIKNTDFKEYFFSFEAFIDLCKTGNIKAINIYWTDFAKKLNGEQNLFYQRWFELGLKACKDRSLIQHLLAKELSKTKIVDCCPKIFTDYAEFLPLNSNSDRKDMVNAISLPSPERVQQKGRLSKKTIGEEIKRPPRSFSQERERQVLRQIATQLFLALENYSSPTNLTGKLVEVQCMHLEAHECANLFIAANEASASHRLAELLKNKKLGELLTVSHKTNSTEGSRRSARFAKKIKNRLFRHNEQIDIMNPTSDGNYVSQIKSILNEGNIKFLELNLIPIVKKSSYNGYELNEKSKKAAFEILSGKNQIVLLKTTIKGYELRHAEEFLADIVDLLEKAPDTHSAVGGKKRPCMGCTGRLSHSGITLFGPRPGRLFVNTVEHQGALAAASSVQIIANNSCYVTQGSDKALYTDFDSASNSDFSEDSEDDSQEMRVSNKL